VPEFSYERLELIGSPLERRWRRSRRSEVGDAEAWLTG
jgi:hypothetical protein